MCKSWRENPQTEYRKCARQVDFLVEHVDMMNVDAAQHAALQAVLLTNLIRHFFDSEADPMIYVDFFVYCM